MASGADAEAAVAGDPPPALTDEQMTVYDRQLRVWGVEAQRRLACARVVVIGSGCLAAEIAKNLALAGVGSLALMDEGGGDGGGGGGPPPPPLTPAAAARRGNFLIGCAPPDAAAAPGASPAAVAAAALAEMNPHIAVAALPPPGPAFTSPGALDAACAGAAAVVLAGAWGDGGGGGGGRGATPSHACGGAAAALAADAAAADAGAAFFWAGVAGPAGWCFANLGADYAYVPNAAEAAAADTDADAGGGGGGGGGARKADDAASVGRPPPPPPPQPAPVRLPFPPLARALAHPWGGLHPRRTHGLATALRVAAAFEAEAGRAPGAGDEAALRARAARLAAADGVAPHLAPGLVSGATPALDALAAGDRDAPATAAVVGGEAGHEIVKALTRRGRPARNLFCFGGWDGRGAVEFFGEAPPADNVADDGAVPGGVAEETVDVM